MRIWDYKTLPRDKMWRLARIAELMLDEDMTIENINDLLAHAKELKLDKYTVKALEINKEEFDKLMKENPVPWATGGAPRARPSNK